MRIRSIKPDFFKDEELCELPPFARLLFAGLWCMADCEGRIKDSPKRIKIEVLPYDDVEIDPLLIQLHEKGFILRYGSKEGQGEDRFIQVIQFHRHQRITGKEAESNSLIPEFNPEIHSEAPGKHPGNNGATTGITGREGKGREGKGTVSGVSPVLIRTQFDLFWNEYPRKVAKEDALKAFKKHECWKHMEAIIPAVRKHRDSLDWTKEDRRFVPHPATWLNGKRWQDESASPSQAHQPEEPPPEASFNMQQAYQKSRAEREANGE